MEIRFSLKKSKVQGGKNIVASCMYEYACEQYFCNWNQKNFRSRITFSRENVIDDSFIEKRTKKKKKKKYAVPFEKQLSNLWNFSFLLLPFLSFQTRFIRQAFETILRILNEIFLYFSIDSEKHICNKKKKKKANIPELTLSFISCNLSWSCIVYRRRVLKLKWES